MSFPSDRIKTDAERSRTHAAAATPLTPSVAAAPTEPVAIGRTRRPQTLRTVDLSPVQHRALDIWQREAADRFGHARVSANTCSNSVYNKSTPGGPCGRRFDLELGVSSKHEFTIASGHRPAEGVQQSLSHHPWHLGEPAAHPPHLSTAAVHPAPEPRGGGSPPIAAPPSMVSMSRIPPKLSRAGVARKALLGGVGGCD
jgi:hypothetical protein